MRLHNLAAQIEANACTFDSSRRVVLIVLDAEEFLEDALAVGRGNARSAVRHGNLHSRRGRTPCILPGRQPDDDAAAAGRVLQGVGEKVGQNDAEPGHVAGDHRVRFVGPEMQRDLGVVEARLKRATVRGDSALT